MMNRSTLAVFLAALALASCGDKGAKPKGQVVATVAGDEITRSQLRAELAGVSVNAANRAELEKAALQQIVARKLVASAARKESVDKSPEFAMSRDRAEEAMLVEAYQQQLVKSVPPASREEIASFMNDNPDVFAQRKVFVVDQIRVSRPADQVTLERFRPLTTMDQVVAFLQAEKMPFQRGMDTLDAVGTDPSVVKWIVRLPGSEVFVIPLPQGVLVNQIRETRVQPFTGPQAEAYAGQMIANQRRQEIVNRRFSTVLTEGREKVSYAKGFEPPAQKKTAAAPLPTADKAVPAKVPAG